MTCAPNSTEPGRLDQHVDLLGSREEASHPRLPQAALPDGLVQRRLRLRDHRLELIAHVRKGVDGPLDAAVVDRHEPHAGDALHDLVGQASRHETGADQADADRFAFGLARSKRVVNKNHVCLLS